MGEIEGKVNDFLRAFFTVMNCTDSLGIYELMNWVEGDPLNLLKQSCVIY